MARPFDFDRATKNPAFFRQWNLCACCGVSLLDLHDHAHHVIPNQIGDTSDPADAFLRSADNCVILCDTCHKRVHANGHYRTGVVAPATYYPHSHGKMVAQRQPWVKRINAEWHRITARSAGGN